MIVQENMHIKINSLKYDAIDNFLLHTKPIKIQYMQKKIKLSIYCYELLQIG